ncbi:MAG: hypothetical protein Q8P48_05505 [Deltaproteobacteria bacterium]|nr:hypothetical protein [Deltaproteobacteria bacterium]
MSTVSIGTNLLIDCENPIVIMGKPLFTYKKDSEGIKLSFDISSPPSNTAIKVLDNQRMEGAVTINTGTKSASITFNNSKLIELIVEGDTAIVNLDLRPLSIHIYTDQNALYVGGSQLSGNIFTNCKNGIAIGG